ncbi:MAG: hypothetical protein AB2693_19415, partial [Candidatus Thiodiazotropha sp.]
NYYLKIFQTFEEDISSITIVIFFPNSSIVLYMANFDREWPSLTQIQNKVTSKNQSKSAKQPETKC